MSNRAASLDACTIHPRAIAALGEPACIAMLGVARDLRSGAIPPERYNQMHWCGTACCIAGHTAIRLGIASRWDWDGVTCWAGSVVNYSRGLYRLFGTQHGETPPARAARAIERYIYEGADDPWGGA